MEEEARDANDTERLSPSIHNLIQFNWIGLWLIYGRGKG